MSETKEKTIYVVTVSTSHKTGTVSGDCILVLAESAAKAVKHIVSVRKAGASDVAQMMQEGAKIEKAE